MRDNSKGLIELIETPNEDGACFSVVDVPGGDGRRRFRFGISQEGHAALRRIFQARPFDSLPGHKYRYFWDRSMGGKTASTIFLGVRCELDDKGKRLEFEVPQELAANLKWLSELKTLDEARHLEIEP